MLPFAVELCLKALKAQGGNEFIRTYNLKLLWEDLKTGEQRAVRKRVEDPAWRNEEPPLISWTDRPTLLKRPVAVQGVGGPTIDPSHQAP